MLGSFGLSGACLAYGEAQEEFDEMGTVREVYQKKFVSKNIQKEKIMSMTIVNENHRCSHR